MTSEEQERLHVHVPKSLKDKLERSPGTQKQNVIEALNIHFGNTEGGSRASIEQQIQNIKEKKHRAEQQRQIAEEQIREYENHLESLQERLESLEDVSESYDEAIEGVLEELRENETSVFKGHPTIERLARDYSKSQLEVLEDLRERSDLHPSHFEEGPIEKPSPIQSILSDGGGE